MLDDKSVEELRKWIRRERDAAKSYDLATFSPIYSGMALAFEGVETKLHSILREQKRRERKSAS